MSSPTTTVGRVTHIELKKYQAKNKRYDVDLSQNRDLKQMRTSNIGNGLFKRVSVKQTVEFYDLFACLCGLTKLSQSLFHLCNDKQQNVCVYFSFQLRIFFIVVC